MNQVVSKDSCVIEQYDQCLQYTFVKSNEDLLIYSALVKMYYKKELQIDLAGHNLDAELLKEASHKDVLLVKAGDKVVGGATITLSSQSSPHRLPMELDGVDVAAMLPERYKDSVYAELSRLAVEEKYRGKDVLHKVIQEAVAYARLHGGCFMFAGAPPINAILYRRASRSLGLPAYIEKKVKYPLKQAYQKVKALNIVCCDIAE